MVPRVSVVMPVRNGERYLAQAVESVLGQTLASLELVAVDDDSTDSTAEILERFAASDPRVRVVAGPGAGLSAALNRGWRSARGAYIARLDADDVALPNRLERQVGFLDRRPAVAVVGSAVIMVDPDLRPITTIHQPVRWETIRSTLRLHNCLTHSAVVIRRSALEEAGGYRFDHVEDYDLWTRIAERHELANLPEPTILYRVHAEQISQAALYEQVRRALAVRNAAAIRRRDGVDPLADVNELTPEVLARLGLADREVESALESEWLARANLLDDLGEHDRAEALVAQAARTLGGRAARATVAARALRNAENLRAAGELGSALEQVLMALRREPRYATSRIRVWLGQRMRARSL